MEENKKQNEIDPILTVGIIASSVLIIYTLGMRKGYKVAVKAMNSVIDYCINALDASHF